MDTFKKALIICRAAVKKSKEQHRIIKEGFNYLIVSETNYNLAYKKHCQSPESEMKLVFTRAHYDNSDLNFDAACILAQKKSETLGGIWHVVKINNFYTEVNEHFFSARPEIKSLCKFESEMKFDTKKLFPNLNRKQRRKLFRK